MFYIQKGVAWNSIQFCYYGLPVISIYSGRFFSRLLSKIKTCQKIKSAKQRNRLSYLLIIAIVFLTLPTTIKTIVQETSRKRFVFIPHNLVDTLQTLKNNSNRDEVVVIQPKGLKFNSSIVYFFSERQAFLADPVTLQITLSSFEDKLMLLNKIAAEEGNEDQVDNETINSKYRSANWQELIKLEPKVKFYLEENIGKISKNNQTVDITKFYLRRIN
jgi:hypothetical protein